MKASTTPHDEAGRGTADRHLGVLLPILSACLAVALFLLSSGHPIPVVPDELGYLAVADYLTTGTVFNVASIAQYRFGQAILLIPAVMLSDSPTQAYLVGVAISCVASALVPLVLLSIAGQLGFKRSPILIVASIIAAVLPAYIYHNTLVWPETTFRLLFVLAIFLFAVAWNRRKLVFWVAASLTIVGLYCLHARALGLLPVTMLSLAFALAYKRISLTAALVAGAILVLGYFAATTAQQQIAAILWPASGSDGTKIGTIVAKLLTAEGFSRLLTTAFGQLWSFVASSFGLFAVGLWFGAILARRPARAPGTAPVLAFGLACTAAIYAASLAQMIGFSRIDHVIYSRYNDGASTFFVWIGLLCVTQSRPSRWPAFTAAALLAIGVLLAALSSNMLALGAPVAPNISAFVWISDFISFSTISLFQLTAFAGVLAAVVVVSFLVTGPRTTMVVLLALTITIDFLVLRSANNAHEGRKLIVDRALVALSSFAGDIYWDRSARGNANVLFDQYALGVPLRWSDISNEALPIGAATIADPSFTRQDYVCVAELPAKRVLLTSADGNNPAQGSAC